eukprot:g1607.t1
MLCYVMICYAMLCYAMLCYAMLCYAILCRYAMSEEEEGEWRQLTQPTHVEGGRFMTCPICQEKINADVWASDKFTQMINPLAEHCKSAHKENRSGSDDGGKMFEWQLWEALCLLLRESLFKSASEAVGLGTASIGLPKGYSGRRPGRLMPPPAHDDVLGHCSRV